MSTDPAESRPARIERLRFDDQPVWLPPSNPEAERALLGSILVSAGVFDRVEGIVTPRDFYRDQHGVIFAAMRDLHDRGEPIDHLTVSSELDRVGKFDAVGGIQGIADLIYGVPTSMHAEHYARLVSEAGVMRRLISAGGRISALAVVGEHDAETAVQKAEALLLEVASSRPQRGARLLVDVLRDYMDQAEAARSGAASTHAIPSGWGDLDTVLRGGLKRSDLIVLAARPGMGKSAMMLGIAGHAAIKLGVGVAIFSLEMSAGQLVGRLLSINSGIETARIEQADLTRSEELRLGSAVGSLAEAQIVIDDSSMLTPSELRSRVRRMSAEHPIGLVIVDYLGLMTTGRDGANRVQEVAEITRQLKALARDEGVAVLALSQLSRAVEQRKPSIPILSDLRDSGSVEQDADVVMFIYRDDYYNRDSDRQGQADVIVAKHRNGPTGQVSLLFNARTTRFLELEASTQGRQWWSD